MILRDYQEDAVGAVFNCWSNQTIKNPLVVMPTGCHAKGSKILMFDGSFKAVELINIGDELMGPDSSKRTVLRLCRGYGDMFKITPKKGESFIVNDDHILNLYKTREGNKFKCEEPRFLNISVKEYVNKPKWFKHVHKLHRKEVLFDNDTPVLLDPWLLGVFIGDGCLTQSNPSLCLPDLEIIEEVENKLKNIDEKLTIKKNIKRKRGCFDLNVTNERRHNNKFKEYLKELGLWGKYAGDKFIPKEYLTSTKENRLKLIAGLIDTDGSLSKSSFDWISKSEKLSDDLKFLCSSVGLSVKKTKCFKKCQSTSGYYYRLSISGDCSIIPNVLSRKKAPKRRQIKNNLVTGFSVEFLNKDDFYGFTLDKDHLYLDDSFIVHHNSGKSPVLGKLCSFIAENGGRVGVLTHRAELIKQDSSAIERFTDIKVCKYSASLKSKEVGQITVAGIQSIGKKATSLDPFDVIFIDECHLIPFKENTLYRRFLSESLMMNPKLKICGLTATPYRLDSGYLHEGEDAIFDGIAYEVKVPELIKRGFLSPIVSLSGSILIDTSGVKKRGGEFIASELQLAANKLEITKSAVQEIVCSGKDRRSWMVFSAGVDHAESIKEMMISLGISCESITGDTPEIERERIIKDFKEFKIRCIVNCQVLTTGFDAPNVDLIAVMTATESTNLYVQILGRGTRIFAGKTNCLLLDYGRNVERHGFFDEVTVKTKNGDGSGEAPVKMCEECGELLHAAVKECTCGVIFPEAKPKIKKKAYKGAVLSIDVKPEEFKVNEVSYKIHKKAGKPDSVRVDYLCNNESGNHIFSEWICPNHDGYARRKFEDLCIKEYLITPPLNSLDFLKMKGDIRTVKKILVNTHKKYKDIIKRIYE